LACSVGVSAGVEGVCGGVVLFLECLMSRNAQHTCPCKGDVLQGTIMYVGKASIGGEEALVLEPPQRESQC
jgi:hypothetical protein